MTLYINIIRILKETDACTSASTEPSGIPRSINEHMMPTH